MGEGGGHSSLIPRSSEKFALQGVFLKQKRQWVRAKWHSKLLLAQITRGDLWMSNMDVCVRKWPCPARALGPPLLPVQKGTCVVEQLNIQISFCYIKKVPKSHHKNSMKVKLSSIIVIMQIIIYARWLNHLTHQYFMTLKPSLEILDIFRKQRGLHKGTFLGKCCGIMMPGCFKWDDWYQVRWLDKK